MQSFKIKTAKILLSLACVGLIFTSAARMRAQTIVDKTVATVSDGVRTELITYSDLLWQLALVPSASLNPPTSADMNRALQLLINQRLFALEARRLPRPDPEESRVNAEIKRVVAQFSSTAEFERRLRLVGFDSIQDDEFQRVMEQRVSIEQYLEFRFRAFVVITPEDEAKYYRETYVPEFRRRNPGILVPSLDNSRKEINSTLTEERVARDIEKFLDDSKRRAEIVILSEV